MLCAVRHDRVDCLQALWKACHKQASNRNDQTKHPVLHEACVRGSAACVKFMLEAGVPTEPSKSTIESPLQAACRCGSSVCAQHLIDAGADVDY